MDPNHPVDIAAGPPLRVRGFTLTELLVVVVIIGLLVAILLPSLAGARRAAMAAQCANNMRQVCAALIGYASENNGRFPQNWNGNSLGTFTIGTSPRGPAVPAQYWCDAERLGNWLPGCRQSGLTYMGGGVLVCPADENGTGRSYSVNVWASYLADTSTLTTAMKPLGTPWSAKDTPSSNLILLAESWSGTSKAGGVFYAKEVIGGKYTPMTQTTTAGQRFGKGGGFPPVMTARWGAITCDMAYNRHRKDQGQSPTTPVGRTNIGYADGHVEMRSDTDLADPTTGQSTLDSLWTPLELQEPTVR